MPPDAAPSTTDTRVPMSTTTYHRLAKGEGASIAPDSNESTWFRSVMGVTIWIASRCRPDITFATHFLSRGMCAPTTTHILAAVHAKVEDAMTSSVNFFRQQSAREVEDFAPETKHLVGTGAHGEAGPTQSWQRMDAAQ
jgi:hypothetical protein